MIGNLLMVKMYTHTITRFIMAECSSKRRKGKLSTSSNKKNVLLVYNRINRLMNRVCNKIQPSQCDTVMYMLSYIIYIKWISTNWIRKTRLHLNFGSTAKQKHQRRKYIVLLSYTQTNKKTFERHLFFQNPL